MIGATSSRGAAGDTWSITPGCSARRKRFREQPAGASGRASASSAATLSLRGRPARPNPCRKEHGTLRSDVFRQKAGGCARRWHSHQRHRRYRLPQMPAHRAVAIVATWRLGRSTAWGTFVLRRSVVAGTPRGSGGPRRCVRRNSPLAAGMMARGLPARLHPGQGQPRLVPMAMRQRSGHQVDRAQGDRQNARRSQPKGRPRGHSPWAAQVLARRQGACAGQQLHKGSRVSQKNKCRTIAITEAVKAGGQPAWQGMGKTREYRVALAGRTLSLPGEIAEGPGRLWPV